MNYKQKLTDLLCECEPVRKQIMELKFWTYISNSLFVDYEDITEWYLVKQYEKDELMFFEVLNSWEILNIYANTDECKLLNQKNKLGYHHLMQYCERSNTDLLIDNWVIVMNWFLWIELNCYKDFDSQEDKVYEDIFNYLSK